MRNQSSNKAIRVNQKNRKSSWEEYATWRCFNFWPIINIFQIRVWLWLVHKITEIHCRSQFFSEVIQTQKKYSTFFYKISILTRGGSRTAATSKMEYFVIIVNGFQLTATYYAPSWIRLWPTCQAHHEKKFGNYKFNWKIIQDIPRIATWDTKVRVVQYKLLYNVWYLNQKLYKFGIVSYVKSFFHDMHDETPLPFFYERVYARKIWNQLRLYLAWKTDLSVLTPHAIFGFVDVWFYLLFNHILLIFKYIIYNPRVNNILNLKSKDWNVLYLG